MQAVEYRRGIKVKLNKFGIKHNPKYPTDVVYTVEDAFYFPGGGVRLTLSCEECPNPRSKTGVYYVLNSGVSTETQIEEAQRVSELLDSTIQYIEDTMGVSLKDRTKIGLKRLFAGKMEVIL